ncbi:hypothetical protein JMUB7524_27420 [Staphylococcus aureus]
MVAVSLKKIFFQAEDGIRDLRMSRGLGDVYKRQEIWSGFRITFKTLQNQARNFY